MTENDYLPAMQKKPIGEMSRIPTDYWSGLMFSKSMPTQAIKEFGGIKQKYELSMATTYEVSIPYSAG